MNVIARAGYHASIQTKGVSTFFRFIGHMFAALYLLITKKTKFPFKNYFIVLHRAGSRIVIPLTLFFCVISYLIITNTHPLVTKWNLKSEALLLLPYFIGYQFIPALVAIFLCIQSALDKIHFRVAKIHASTHAAMITRIMPTMLGTLSAILLLYFYCLSASFVGIYLALVKAEQASFNQYIMILNDAISFYGVLLALGRTLFFALIAAMVVAYYHYQIAIGKLSLRICVSRTITRGILWVVLASVYFNLLN